MKKKIILISSLLIFLGIVALSVLYISTHSIPVLQPKGVIGAGERRLLIVTSILMLIVLIPVYLIAIWVAWKYRAENSKADYKPDWGDSFIAECVWWGVPLIIISFLAVITWTSSHKLNPFRPIDSSEKPITIQVVALQWKWLFIYPESGIATVNYINIPQNVPIQFEITADAPMNSFWIPQLGGQIYAMPAMRSKLHLMANEVGVYRGSSSNLSGKGFAGMYFNATALTQKDFDSWLASAKGSRKSLGVNEYNLLAQPSESHPIETYRLSKPNLFEIIIGKYMPPSK